MFKNKRLEELERRVEMLERTQDKMLLGDIEISTFEYGRMPMREAIRRLAAFVKKETARHKEGTRPEEIKRDQNQ